jgi:hypothetical protein
MRAGDFMKQWVVISICLLLFTGCVSDYRTPIPKKEIATYQPVSDEGFLVGSFAYQGIYIDDDTEDKSKKRDAQDYYEYSFHCRLQSDRGVIGQIVPEGIVKGKWFYVEDEGDFAVKNGKGYMFVLPLRAGDYEFNQWAVSHVYGSEYCFSPSSFVVPFTIEANKALYLGEARANLTLKKRPFWGGYISERVFWIVSDKSGRDLPLLKKMYPFLKDIDIEKAGLTEALNQKLMEKKR